jgi:hypothetical protein
MTGETSIAITMFIVDFYIEEIFNLLSTNQIPDGFGCQYGHFHGKPPSKNFDLQFWIPT